MSENTSDNSCFFFSKGKEGFDRTSRCTNGGKCTEENFCYGCKQFICENHDISGPFGSHSPEEHLKWPED